MLGGVDGLMGLSVFRVGFPGGVSLPVFRVGIGRWGFGGCGFCCGTVVLWVCGGLI